ncbi:MAG: choice-of-anchor E domain-containing protein [Bryobacteraceae bacterium]
MSFLTKAVPMALMTVFLGASSAFGATITQTCTIAVQAVPYDSAVGAPPNPCSFNLFNSSTGTLLGVTLQISGVGGSVQAQQTNTSLTTNYTFTNSVTTIGLVFTGPDATIVSVNQASTPPCSGTVNANTTNTTCAATVFSGLNGPVVAAASIAAYQGAGGGSFNVNASGQLVSASGSGGPGSAGRVFFGGDGSIGGTVTLSYDYTPGQSSVPEPSTSALIGSGLIGLFALARRRSRRS